MRLIIGLLGLILATNAFAMKLTLPYVMPGHEDEDWSVLVTVTDGLWRSVDGSVQFSTTVEFNTCVVDCGTAPVQPTQGYVKLDGRFYLYSGTMQLYDAVILYGQGSTTAMSNCKRANGSALPSSSVLLYLPGFQVVSLASDSTWKMYRTGGVGGGNVFEIESSSGDAVCTGEVAPPTNDLIFANGFER